MIQDMPQPNCQHFNKGISSFMKLVTATKGHWPFNNWIFQPILDKFNTGCNFQFSHYFTSTAFSRFPAQGKPSGSKWHPVTTSFLWLYISQLFLHHFPVSTSLPCLYIPSLSLHLFPDYTSLNCFYTPSQSTSLNSFYRDPFLVSTPLNSLCPPPASKPLDWFYITSLWLHPFSVSTSLNWLYTHYWPLHHATFTTSNSILVLLQ